MSKLPEIIGAPIKYHRARLILEVENDTFEICHTKVIKKKRWLLFGERKFLVHRQHGREKWDIKEVD